jgi:hypothetical protein
MPLGTTAAFLPTAVPGMQQKVRRCAIGADRAASP